MYACTHPQANNITHIPVPVAKTASCKLSATVQEIYDGKYTLHTVVMYHYIDVHCINVSMFLSTAHVAFLQLVATPHGHLLLRWHIVLQVYRTTHNLRCIYILCTTPVAVIKKYASQ